MSVGDENIQNKWQIDLVHVEEADQLTGEVATELLDLSPPN